MNETTDTAGSVLQVVNAEVLPAEPDAASAVAVYETATAAVLAALDRASIRAAPDKP
ncbi:hypothetical protein ACFWSF_40350 [Streptomyces sp. NPDC058611]|uniref:hypothetical protein n=1 Tax=unclassified Streptomyces TaxID=2593676 RepID=UPI003668513C